MLPMGTGPLPLLYIINLLLPMLGRLPDGSAPVATVEVNVKVDVNVRF